MYESNSMTSSKCWDIWVWVIVKVIHYYIYGNSIKMQWLVANCHFLSFIVETHSVSSRNYSHQHWRREQVFYIKSSRLWDHHSPWHLSTIHLDRLVSPREEEILNKSHDYPAWLKASLTNVWLQENEKRIMAKNKSQIKLLHLSGEPCSDLTEHRTTAWRWEVDQHLCLVLKHQGNQSFW